MASMKYVGSCHCGDNRFSVEGDFGAAIECNCSHCSRKGYLLWFAPRDRFTLETPRSQLGVYTFNKHVIHHTFCKTCGIKPFARGHGPQGPTIAINMRTIENLDLGALNVVPYDGKNH